MDRDRFFPGSALKQRAVSRNSPGLRLHSISPIQALRTCISLMMLIRQQAFHILNFYRIVSLCIACLYKHIKLFKSFHVLLLWCKGIEQFFENFFPWDFCFSIFFLDEYFTVFYYRHHCCF